MHIVKPTKVKPVDMPSTSIGACKNSKMYLTSSGRIKYGFCENLNVELGNGYCIVCWDKKSGSKVVQTVFHVNFL